MPRDEGEIEIRVRRDGRVYVDGLCAGLLEFASELAPHDAELARRRKRLRPAAPDEAGEGSVEGNVDGDADTG